MELEPHNLRIPLRRRNWLWAQVLAAVLLVAIASYAFFPVWGRAFLATSLVALPGLILMVVPSRRRGTASKSGSFAVVAALVIYLFIAERLLVPTLLEHLP